MRLRRIGLTALITILATIVSVDLGFPVLGQLIQNPKSKIQNSQVLAQTVDEREAEDDILIQQDLEQFDTNQFEVEGDIQDVEADTLLKHGLEQFHTSQFEAALQSWQQALTIYREIKDRKGEGNALGNLGIAYNALGDYAKAIEYHQQSLAIAREIKDRLGEGQSLGNLGVDYARLGDYANAVEYQQQRLAIAREIKDRKGEGQSLGNLGIAYRLYNKSSSLRITLMLL